ncbi:ABC transporter permease [[Micrococcus luteus] ATCC 49442]|uniref:ABC transporter permease n=1 Tax=[Micrococcus luteus] ATCC 49442 TaxID=2698727 RepID=UPI0013DACF46|nr:ABC transporter permease [[Micrococcus luteus] ATCC 49442]
MFLAIRDIRFAKGRFALMGGVVALVTLLLVLLFGLTAGLGDQSTSAIGKLGAGTAGGSGDSSRLVDSIVFGAPGSNEPTASFTESEVTAAQVDAWQRVPGVARAEPLGISQTRFQAGDGGTTDVAVFGVASDGGLAPSPVRAGTVVIGSTVAADLSLDVGDTARVGGNELTVTAVVDDQWYSHTGVVWTALPSWAEVAHISPAGGAAANPPVATVVAVTYEQGAAVDEAAANAAAGTVSASRTGSFQALGSFKSENGSLMLMQGFLYGISALVIVAFLTVWTVQRTRDIAVLKAMGASGRYVLRDAMTQALLVLVAGAGIGGAVGVLGGFAAAQAAPFLVTPATTLLPVLGIVALGLAGAALAVRRVTTVDPLIALGGN